MSCVSVVLVTRRRRPSVQAPPSPFVLVGLVGRGHGDGAAVLVGLHEERLAHLVLVQHAVRFLHDRARGQLFAGQDPRVLCNDRYVTSRRRSNVRLG